MQKSLIFDIEEFTLHDGPGIRKTVFFKGCPLKCSWCHNPEGMSFEKELMVSKASCINCGKCANICEKSDCGNCSRCGKCVRVCPLNLRKICGKEYDAKDLAKELLKGKEILEGSGGGITISGGEPLAQPEFLIELIENLKPIHTAIETSGHAPNCIFTKIISMVDLVLIDLKHSDSMIHTAYTSVGNEVIIENIKTLCRMDTKFYLRIPLIPGVNDTLENMEKTAELVKDAKNLERVELLPYHTTAGAKYPMLGRQYNPNFDESIKPRVFMEPFRKYNIRSDVL